MQRSSVIRPPRQDSGGSFDKIQRAMQTGAQGVGIVGSLANAGMKAADFISTLMGSGDYTVAHNTLVEGGSVPTFKQSGEGVVVCHREFIKDIVGTTAFNIGTLQINPGLSDIFPWLSRIAGFFEEYEFRGLIFEYRPSSGLISSASAALGVVVFATDYNALSTPFSNKQSMESYQFSSSCPPFQSMLHPVECARGANPLESMYVRTGNAPADADLRLYDMGLFEFATVGMPSAYTTGELWVSYDLVLKKPRISDSVDVGTFLHIISSDANLATAVAPLGTSGGVVNSSSNIPGATATTTSFTLPVSGKVLMLVTFIGTGIATYPTITVGANITTTQIFDEGGSSGSASFSAAGVSAAIWRCLSVSQVGHGIDNTVTLGTLTGYAAGSTDVVICSLPTNVNLNLISASFELNKLRRQVDALVLLHKRSLRVDLDDICEDDFKNV